MSGRSFDRGIRSAINPRRVIEFGLTAAVEWDHLNLLPRPEKDSFSSRLGALFRKDFGNYNKGVLAGWQIDQRDPTADVRLLEYCLAVPTEQFLHNGTPRALARRAFADRLPKLVLEETRGGLQAADWHERLTAARDRVAAELERLEGCPPATRVLNLPHLHRLVQAWPRGGWERAEVEFAYRNALLNGISAGHFLRRVSGSNF